jgi:hypothetical protein
MFSVLTAPSRLHGDRGSDLRCVTLAKVLTLEASFMAKNKAKQQLAEWLIDKIDANDIEGITAFRTWLSSGQTGRFECYVAQEAWSELLENSKVKTLH